MKKRTWSFGAALVVAATLAGCVSYRATSLHNLDSGEEVRIWLAGPDTVVFTSAQGQDVSPLFDVVFLEGRISAVEGDSVRMVVSRVSRVDSDVDRLRARIVASFRADAIAAIERQHEDAGKTVAAILAGALIFGMLVMVIAAANAPEPEPVTKDDGKGTPTYP